MANFEASGKLMLFGEYLVLCGSKSLAVPTVFGQKMMVEPNDNGQLHWSAYEPNGQWFSCRMDQSLAIQESSDHLVAEKLQNLLTEVRKQRNTVSMSGTFTLSVDFDLSWGLGSSSTLISLLSQWSGVDPFELSDSTFGGSGYDVACATASQPILFQRSKPSPIVEPVSLSPNVADHILFVFSGQKQSSANEVQKFNRRNIDQTEVDRMSDLVDATSMCDSIETFERLVKDSEQFVSRILGREPIGQQRFGDYQYAVKSLGAWGGDFFLATFRDLNTAKSYFIDRGYTTSFSYGELAK
ncbi:MAG: GYDIA family GHMP kinase [Planctomycetota bacterium]